MSYLEVLNISKSYGDVRALVDVSFEVDEGEYFCIVGPTGAGKTTLLKIIAGLLKPDHGRIVLDGVDVTYMPSEERGVAYMPQGYALFPHMTVWENVAYGAAMKGLSKERAIMALKMVGLLHRKNSYPHELSGGQQQRVALARAIASGSRLLLLDEPLSALDLLLNIELRYELRRYAKELGLTVLHVTHDSEEAMSIADRLLVLNKGRVQQIGEPEEVYIKPRNLFIAKFLGDATMLRGRVIDIEDDFFMVEVEGLGLVKVRGHPPTKDLVLVIRPEDILLVDENDVFDDNVFKGKVRDVEFQGVKARLHVVVGEVEVLLDAWLDSGYIMSLKGKHVLLKMPSNRILVYEDSGEDLHYMPWR